MVLSYTYIFQFCVILQCMTLWRSGMQSPACTLHFTDVFDEFQYFQDGDLIIGGVLTVRSKEDNPNVPEEKIYSPSFWYYLNLLAFLTTIDNINQDPDILPNISLGFHLYDSWLEPRKGVQSVLQILSGPNGTIPNYSCKGQGKLAGVIGDRYSSTTIPIAQILGMYRYTQISYWATDYSLSDRLLYPHVFRTIQNDYVHYLAIAKLVKYFGWNWVGIFFSDNDTGENEAQILKKHLAFQEICVAFEKRMTKNSATINQWRDTLSKVQCKVLILCGSFTNNARIYLSAYTHINRNNMLILPPGWTLAEIKMMTVLIGFITSLSLGIFDPPIHIDKNLFGVNLLSRHSQIGLLMDDLIVTFHNITSTQNGKNIYFQNVSNSTNIVLRMHIRIIDKHIIFGESLRVYIAVEAMAEAIHIFNQFNHSFNINRFNQLQKYVKQIKNPYKTADRMTFFDQNGEFPFYYKIVNGVKSFRHLSTSKTDVGLYTPWAEEEDQLHIDPNNITWDEDNNTKLESRCVDSCLPGYRKKPGASIHACCYDCVPCSEGQISNMTDSENCMKCPDDEWPNEKKNRCVPKLVEFLSYTDDPIVAVFSAVSILCCLLTGLILGMFIHYQDTPIVKANNRNLSYLLLVSIMLSFLCVFLFLGHPVDVTCMLRVTSFGVIFSVAVSTLLAKSTMVCIAFKATKPGSHWRKWMGAKLPNFIMCVFSLVQVIICVTWLFISPPFQDRDTHSYQGKIIIQCNEGSVIGFYSVLGYMGLLAAVSFIIAFLARTLPDSFNEAKYITFSMLVFCSVWIAMIPAYLSTRGKYMVAVEVFAIITSSTGLLGCIFFPKCYIILFRPDLNTKIAIH
ncbi:vomeronasal type-2 receptor 26-like [Aquarana catesbeiana]|uniref:vomeronasal type-2 receptor 26-like n=1 Tax=Aquarana catesbeiana TaxID=8400 RepID=UPI003CC94E7D